MATGKRASELPARQALAVGPRFLWMAAAGGLPPLSLMAPTLLVPALFVLAALALVAGHYAGARPVVPWRLAVLILALVAWGTMTSLWALDPALSLYRAAKLALVAAAGILLVGAARTVEARHQPAIAWSLLAGFTLALSIAVVALFASGAIDVSAGDGALRIAPFRAAGLKRGLSVLFLFAWVLAAGLAAAGRFPLAWLCLAIPPGVMLLMKSEASVVAWACGIAGLLAGRLFSDRVLLFLTPSVGLYAVLVPFLTRLIPGDLTAWAGSLPFSALHRLAMWRFTAERVFERPFLGWGLENVRVIPGGKEPAGIADFIANRPADGRDLSALVEALRLDPPQLLPLHPHNFVLQVWLELGVPGVALATGVLVVVLFALLRAARTRWQRGLSLGLFLATATLASLSYGAWQTWWHATFWILAAFMVIFSGRTEPQSGARPAK